MKHLRRLTVAAVVSALLVLAIPAQAAPSDALRLGSPLQQIHQWLDSFWEAVAKRLVSRPGKDEGPPLPPAPVGPGNPPPSLEGGGCLDPNGLPITCIK